MIDEAEKIIMGAAGLVATMITWFFRRQVTRIDDHDKELKELKEHISSLHESNKGLDMQASQMRSDHISDIGRVEFDAEEREKRTDKRIDAAERRNDMNMARLSEHFETFFFMMKKQGKDD